MQPARAFAITPTIKRELVKIIDDRIKEVHVTKEDFSELKAIVKDIGVKVGELAETQKRTDLRMEELTVAQKELTEAQKRTETKVEELAEAQKRTETKVEELAEAQKRTETRVEELAEAQKRTETRVEELAEAQKRTETRVEELAIAQKQTEVRLGELTLALKELAEAQKQTSLEIKSLHVGLKDNRDQIGGLSQSMGYAFENEAYRFLPRLLEEKHGLKINEKMIRTEIGGEEINLFCRAQKNGKEVLIVGESKLRLDDKRAKQDALAQLDKKIAAVKSEHGEIEIVPVLVTHFAKKGFLELAKEEGIVVVQSHEW